MTPERTTDRTVLRIAGSDAHSFLKGLVTRDPAEGLTYSALLTPQGKYLADFFLLDRGDDILLDVNSAIAASVAQRLSMYRLRADVVIEEAGVSVSRGLSEAPEGALLTDAPEGALLTDAPEGALLTDAPEGAMPDPRHPSLGWRLYGPAAGAEPAIDWDALRVAACVPETGIELIPNETYILEAGFDRLSGVDHRKGCYVGQEVTARMKHKTVLKKGLVTVEITGSAPVGTEITADGKPAGTLYTQSGGRAIAYLRFDRAMGPMMAGDAVITWAGTA